MVTHGMIAQLWPENNASLASWVVGFLANCYYQLAKKKAKLPNISKPCPPPFPFTPGWLPES